MKTPPPRHCLKVAVRQWRDGLPLDDVSLCGACRRTLENLARRFPDTPEMTEFIEVLPPKAFRSGIEDCGTDNNGETEAGLA